MSDLIANLPFPNVPLLRKAVEWAEAEAAKPPAESQWNQQLWAEEVPGCGTTYCIAGYTVMSAMPNAQAAEDEYGELELYVDGEEALWGDTAAGLLGLTWDERRELFQGSNDIATVRAAAEQIAARAGDRL